MKDRTIKQAQILNEYQYLHYCNSLGKLTKEEFKTDRDRLLVELDDEDILLCDSADAKNKGIKQATIYINN